MKLALIILLAITVIGYFIQKEKYEKEKYGKGKVEINKIKDSYLD